MIDALDLRAYDFDLPEAAIAQTPVEPRHAARLLVLDQSGDAVAHHTVADLPHLLPPRALLVVNDTRVVPARLLGHKASGGRVELLLTRPFATPGADLLDHEALARSSKPLKVGHILALDGGGTATITALPGHGVVRVDLSGFPDLAALLAACGHVPLPPYIRGGKEQPELDRPRYQSTFADVPGAVAAPTAGLHLSTELLAQLADAGVELARVTLHVGPGTFLPVRDPDLRHHRVLPERAEISQQTADAIARARVQRRAVIAVGTTTTRTLEDAALRGNGVVAAGRFDADLTILPGHRFQIVDGLMTNFHLPQSSLLVLVSALAGRERILTAYAQAIAAGYRFYSYGDAMLVLPGAQIP